MTERERPRPDATERLPEPADRAAMRAEVLAALRAPQRHIPSKYHYDARGSALFERITRLDEYYLTRVERSLLGRHAPDWAEELGPEALVELGPGSGEKSRILLDAIVRRRPDALYVPVDVAAESLEVLAGALRAEYPRLRVEPEIADIGAELRLGCTLPEPAWIAFLGSTLGNFEEEDAVRLLRGIASLLRTRDRLLLGVDLRPGPTKSRERVELAYNDPAGVTEAFSRNVLEVLNRELGSDFDPAAFAYRSSYDEARGRIETYLESLRPQVVRFPGGEVIELARGERIRTEISAKYDRPTIEALFARAALAVDRWVEDERGYYALALGRAQPLDAGR